jgi:hypothetical protein
MAGASLPDRLKSLGFPKNCFVRIGDETILARHETIFRFWCRHPETADGYQADNNNGGQRRQR